MAKDPAFLFYSSDFLSGVQDLTMEERGQYITLLCIQHQKGHLSEKLIRLAVASPAADVMAKFRQDSAGLWYNPRLEIETEKRKASSDKQRDRALSRWKKQENNAAADTVGDATAQAPAVPLENENRNENENVIVFGIKKELRISIAKKYIADKVKHIFDLEEYFRATDQLAGLQEAGWTQFQAFMAANPAAVYNDDRHLYNAFKQFSCAPGKGKPDRNIDDL